MSCAACSSSPPVADEDDLTQPFYGTYSPVNGEDPPDWAAKTAVWKKEHPISYPSFCSFLAHHIDEITSLSPLEFKRFMKIQICAWYTLGMQFSFYKSLCDKFHAKRALYYQTHVPQCRSNGSVDNGVITLPKYPLEPLSSLHTVTLSRPNPIWNPDSREELDKLVVAMRASDLFAWEYGISACRSRANVMLDIAMRLGIPSTSMFKAYFYASPNERVYKWAYHAALIIRLDIDYVLDPILSPKKALTLEEWASLQLKTKRPYATYDKREEMGTELTLNHDPALFIFAHMQDLLENVPVDPEHIRFSFTESFPLQDHLTYLNEKRLFVENDWIECLLLGELLKIYPPPLQKPE